MSPGSVLGRFIPNSPPRFRIHLLSSNLNKKVNVENDKIKNTYDEARIREGGMAHLEMQEYKRKSVVVQAFRLLPRGPTKKQYISSFSKDLPPALVRQTLQVNISGLFLSVFDQFYGLLVEVVASPKIQLVIACIMDTICRFEFWQSNGLGKFE